MWNGLEIPNRPSSNGNIPGTPLHIFADRVVTYKSTWSGDIITGSLQLTFVDAITLVVRHIVSPTGVMNSRFIVDSVKTRTWMQSYQPGTFGERTLTATQIGSILSQIRNMGRYNLTSGYVDLEPGDKISVVVDLSTSPSNHFILYLSVCQT
jgi:hypothetical protein